MGRKRRRLDQWMPQYVTRGKSAFEFRRPGKTARLCDLDASQAEVWAAYEKEISSSQYTFRALMDEFFKSEHFKSRANSTQSDYIKYSKKSSNC